MQIVLDYETRSEADLKKVGGVKYAQDPSTEILCVGYKLNDGPAKVWVPSRDPIPVELAYAAHSKTCIWIAHNALFEQAITEYVLRRNRPEFPHLPPERWKCTAAKAAACALPRNLEGACLALDLPVKKNMDGRRLMLKYCKPRRAWSKWAERNADAEPEPEKYFDTEMELWAIYDYCKTDVEAEYLLDKKLPDLIPNERRVWLLNQAMNLRGVQVDTETAALVLKLIDRQSKALQGEVKTLTGGAITSIGQRDKVLEWLEENGVSLPNLNAKSVSETLDAIDEVNLRATPVERLLQIRQMLSKSSTKKYEAMLNRAGRDGRVRDLALYHGASTGRESGTGLQLHNLPKGKIGNTNRAIEVLKTGDVDFISALYGNPMNVFSACIRGMVTASPGFSLYAADYNAIEARVLAWVAGDEDALDVFRNNLDPYVKAASGIFKIPQSKVTPEQRQIGKIAELGLGYQMGPPKFFKTCLDWGVKGVTLELAHAAVKAYRETHSPIAKLWPRMERAAIEAVRKPGKAVKLNRVTWAVQGEFLTCELPSGRKLRYYGPAIRNEPTPWGELRPKLYFWSVNSLTKKWECSAVYGGLLVENIVQAIGRDLTMNAALNCERAGYTYLFQVHDELVAESKGGSVLEFEKILTTLPPWAEGLPIVAKGWTGRRYKK